MFLDDITLPPDNYLATYSKKITVKIVSPSSTGSASRLSSSGGASPESDPAATTWCSMLEWSPPNTLLRISTRALSVRASAPLLEGVKCDAPPPPLSAELACRGWNWKIQKMLEEFITSSLVSTKTINVADELGPYNNLSILVWIILCESSYFSSFMGPTQYNSAPQLLC
nr:hypothetical protein Iba_chr02aCG16490 [Ipomoea batatas]